MLDRLTERVVRLSSACAEVRFKVGHVARGHVARHAKLAGCGGKAAQISHRDEDLQLPASDPYYLLYEIIYLNTVLIISTCKFATSRSSPTPAEGRLIAACRQTEGTFHR
jgi:hypothetical protein